MGSSMSCTDSSTVIQPDHLTIQRYHMDCVDNTQSTPAINKHQLVNEQSCLATTNCTPDTTPPASPSAEQPQLPLTYPRPLLRLHSSRSQVAQTTINPVLSSTTPSSPTGGRTHTRRRWNLGHLVHLLHPLSHQPIPRGSLPQGNKMPTYEQLMQLMDRTNGASVENASPVHPDVSMTPSPEPPQGPQLLDRRASRSGRWSYSRGGSLHAGLGLLGDGSIGGVASGSPSTFLAPPWTPRTGSNSAFASPCGSSPLIHRTRTSSPRASGHVTLDMSLANTAPSSPLCSSHNVLPMTDGPSDVVAGGWASSATLPSATVNASMSVSCTPQHGSTTHSAFSAPSASYHLQGVLSATRADFCTTTTTNSKPRSHRQLFATMAPTMDDTMQT